MDRADDDDPDVPVAGPVHPDDRLWRHPSELASAGLPSALSPLHGGAGHVEPGLRRRGVIGLWLPVALAGAVGALLTVGLLTATGGFQSAPVEYRPTSSTSSTVTLAISSHSPPVGVADLAERLRPSVFALSGIGPDGRVSRGSAVAVSRGHVLTAAHLIAASRELEVLVGGVERSATLVGTDPDTDLALLAVDGGGLVPVQWGAAANLRPGDPAVAVSSAPAADPGPTVTVGIVSGIARTLAQAGTELRGLLQVDRPVPAEGAGGALLDPAGALLGITLPAAATSAPFGYAVPAEVAKEVAAQLLSRGRVAHAWLGIEGTDVGVNGGTRVERVKPASPAFRAGLLDGDVLLNIDGKPTPTMGMLLLALRSYHPGDSVNVRVLRGERTFDLPVTLAERE